MIYLPIIRNDNFREYIIKADWQLRKNLQYSECLEKSAQEKADLIMSTGIISHVINGEHPNALVRRFCVNLHQDYSPNNNYVEALVWGLKDFYQGVNALLASTAHKPIMIGSGWYQRQTHFGIGYNNICWVFHFGDFM